MRVSLGLSLSSLSGASGSTPTPTPSPSWTAPPSISPSTGPWQVGDTLTGLDGTISNGSVSARAWLRGGDAISGATSSTYTLAADDLDANIAYRPTATGPGGSASATSEAIGPVEAAPVDPTAPVITYDAETGLFGNANSDPGQWYRDDAPITDEAGATYTYVEATDAGRAISQYVGGVQSNIIILQASGIPVNTETFDYGTGAKLTDNGWTGLPSSATSETDKFVVGSDGRAQCTAQTIIDDIYAIVVKDTDSQTHFVEWPANQTMRVLVKVTDERNYVWVQRVNSDGVQMQQVVDGVQSLIAGSNEYLNITGGMVAGNRLRVEILSNGNIRFLHQTGAGPFLPYRLVKGESTQEDVNYPLNETLDGGTQIGLRGSGATVYMDDMTWGSLQRPILFESVAAVENIETGELVRSIQLTGKASRATSFEALVLDTATGALITDWAPVDGAAENFTVNVPITDEMHNRNVTVWLTDDAHREDAASASITIPIYQTVFPLIKGMNEGATNEYSAMSRERNAFNRCPIRLSSAEVGDDKTYLHTHPFANTGLDTNGQYHALPVGATYYTVNVPPGLPLGEYEITYPTDCTASWTGPTTGITDTQALSGGTGRISLSAGYTSSRNLKLTPADPSDTNFGPANLSIYKVGETDKVSYLSDEFKTFIETAGIKAFRNMGADVLNTPLRMNGGVFSQMVNRGNNYTGPLSPKAWGEISHLNGGMDILISIPLEANDSYIEAFATALRDEGNINASSSILPEYFNETWNFGQPFFNGYSYCGFNGVKLGYHGGAAIPDLISIVPNVYWSKNASGGLLLIALEANDIVFDGYKAWQTSVARSIGDPVPGDDNTENWTIVSSDPQTATARAKWYSKRSGEIFDIFDDVFGSERIRPFVQWQLGGFSGLMKTILDHGNLYQKMAGRGIAATAPYYNDGLANKFSDHIEGVWGPTEKAWFESTDPTEAAAGQLALFNAAKIKLLAAADQDVKYKHDLAAYCVSKGLDKDSIQKGSYEFNWHPLFYETEWVNKVETPAWSENVFAAANNFVKSSYMGELVALQMQHMKLRIGGEQFFFNRGGNLLTSWASDNAWHYWGLAEREDDIGSDNHRFTAFATAGAS